MAGVGPGVVVGARRGGVGARGGIVVALLLAVSGCIGGDKQTSASGASGSTSGAVTSSTVTTDAATSTSTSGTGTTSAASGTSSTSSAEVCEPVDSFGEETTGDLPDCDIWAQDCPPCEKCTPWASEGGSAWNAHGCVPVVPNPKQLGEPCTAQGPGVSGFDDCDKGLMCWSPNEANVGYCIGLCVGSEIDPECEYPAVCAVGADGVLAICLPPL